MTRLLPSVLIATLIGGGAAVTLEAFAQDPSPPAAEVSPRSSEAPAPGDMANPTEGHKEVSGPSTLPEKLEAAAPKNPDEKKLADQVEELKQQLAAYRAADDPAAKRLALLALLGSITWALLAAVNRFRDLSPKGKRVLPYVAVGLGVLAGIFDAVAMGASWVQAATTALGPTLAVVFHELIEGWTGKRQAAPGGP